MRVRQVVAAVALLAAVSAGADVCDISVTPAATLLLPYFQVSATQTTVVNVINTASAAVIARVTLWTDFGYPVVSFNLAMRAHGIESIDLRNVLATGRIAHHGALCPSPDLPESLRAEVFAALTTGRLGSCATAGQNHKEAIGYATIDVVANCEARTPWSPEYFTTDLRFDNVLTGDYEEFISGKDAAGAPLVHVRAVTQPVPRTFYARFSSGGNDRRQPLPSLFAPRYIDLSHWNDLPRTSLRVWREPPAGRDRPCVDTWYQMAYVGDAVAFDEHENARMIRTATYIEGQCIYEGRWESAWSNNVARLPFPLSGPTSGDVGGWLYLNLAAGGLVCFDLPSRNTASQGWVVIGIDFRGGASLLMDAAWLDNGCSETRARGAKIGAPPPNTRHHASRP